MAANDKKTYLTTRRIKHNGKIYEVDKPIELTEHEAAQLKGAVKAAK